MKEPVAIANVDAARKWPMPAFASPRFGAVESPADAFNKPIDQKSADQFHHEFDKEIEQHMSCIIALVADFVKAGKSVIPSYWNCAQIFPPIRKAGSCVC